MFRDRRDAGRRLAAALGHLAPARPLVLALPRGGVPVGFEVAVALRAPLDVLVARKLGAPGRPELGLGAIAPGGVRVVDEAFADALGVSPEALDAVSRQELAELERRQRAYRGDLAPPEVAGATAILVDDGLATGGTMRAAVAWARRHDPRRVVVAVPVGPDEAVATLRREADEVVCLAQPEDFRAVGLWYERFDQTTDEEVVELLRAARGAGLGAPPSGVLH